MNGEPAAAPVGTGARISGTGRHLPAAVLTNADLATTLQRDDAWILQRTGIRERRVATPGSGTASMAAAAAREALAAAGRSPESVDVIVVATSTPDHLTPPTACEVQAALGARGAAAFDIEAGFAGWLYALIIADGLLSCGTAGVALVIGADTLSTVTDRTDPATAPLFGDGAGAVVLEAGSGPGLRLGARSWWADGRLASSLRRPGGGSRQPFDRVVLDDQRHLLRMEGTRLFRQAVRTMAAQAQAVLDLEGIAWEDVDLVVPHQANLRILEAFAAETGVSPERVFVNIEWLGNTGSATVPIALDEATRAGCFHDARRVLLVSFGAGATAGAMLLHG